MTHHRRWAKHSALADVTVPDNYPRRRAGAPMDAVGSRLRGGRELRVRGASGALRLDGRSAEMVKPPPLRATSRRAGLASCLVSGDVCFW